MWDSITNNSCKTCQCPARPKTQRALADKENMQTLSPAKNDELSFYGGASPGAPQCSPRHCPHARRPLEDHDASSRDSGYLTAYSENSIKFSSYASPSRGSFESFCSMEDDFFEGFSDIEPLEDNALPQDFNKLLSDPIAASPRDIRPMFRRALSLQNEPVTPSRARSCLFKANPELRPFKRPEPPVRADSPLHTSGYPVHKKAKLTHDEEEMIAAVPSAPRPLLQRAFSSTEESIMSAVHRSSTEPDLIGDFSKTFGLPLTPGRHQDLKSITADTLVRLMGGDFDANIGTFKVIDCRYPYEFEGGHIDGAVNIYTRDQCMELLKNFAPHTKGDASKRDILVFHCEFSSERGPNLYRYLRKQDRQMNELAYPCLHYPEIYLLEGGYKSFFEQHASLCVPEAYKEMLHPEHESDLKYFRQKSKTWNTDTRHRLVRSNLKRLGF